MEYIQVIYLVDFEICTRVDSRKIARIKSRIKFTPFTSIFEGAVWFEHKTDVEFEISNQFYFRI